MRIGTGLLVTLALLLSAPATAAQALDGEWFRIKLSADGVGFDPETELATKGKVKPLVRYAQFVLEEGVGDGPAYTLIGYAPTESGAWAEISGGLLTMLDAAETFAFWAGFVTSTLPLPVPGEEGAANIVVLTFNATAKLKVKNEELKSAKLTSQGLFAEFSNDSFFHFGKGKITMTRIPESKLPFDPSLVMKSTATVPALPHRATPRPATAPVPVPASVPALAPSAPD